MPDSIPKFHETFLPMLNVLADGSEIHREELKRIVLKEFYSNLPEELLNQKTSSGGSLISNRIGWEISYLKQGKFIEQPRRAYVRVTSKGTNALSKGHLSLSDLKKDSDYIAARVAKEEAKQGIIVDQPDKDDSPQDLIEQGFVSIKQNIKSELLERLKTIDPFYFEKIILILLKRMGYGEFVETKKTGDGGIDGIINQDQLGLNKIYIQAKRYAENKVREKDIRNFIGAMSGDTTNGVFVTTSTL